VVSPGHDGGAPQGSGSGAHAGADAGDVVGHDGGVSKGSDAGGGGDPDGGAHGSGDAGLAPVPDSGTPTPVGAGLTKVGTGEYETFYLKDGVVYGIGTYGGTLGIGSINSEIALTPTPIAAPAGLLFLDVQGGLHQSLAVDVNGTVWTWGDNALGQAGVGTITGTVNLSPVHIETDSKGNAFDNVIAVASWETYDAALKSDGTVWAWGDLTGGGASGISGDGTTGSTVTRPTQIPVGNTSKVTKILVAAMMMALTEDGTVYSWGDDGSWQPSSDLGRGGNPLVPGVVTMPAGAAKIVDIALYGAGAYAVDENGVLYGWGVRTDYLGINSTDGHTQATPVALHNLPHPVKSIVCSSDTAHAILTDGTLWGWGANGNGGAVGNGGTEVFQQPYANDWGPDESMVLTPVQIAPGVTFDTVWSNTPYTFYVYAMSTSGQLYSWGRNKTDVLGNGVYPVAASGNGGAAANIAATYPNSWDVTLAAPVNPFTVTPKGELSPYCVANPSSSPCDE
jgi:alpha-tubulin suppressor-like RCC1 family protein